jgi:asparagine synthase (glutamine-hydrolysing)
MCGINGFNFEDKVLIEKMNAKIAHRGPDDSGVFLSSGISLGHNRLSIIDLSSAAHQPMESRDGRYIIVYNGELYNFKEIKAELGEYEFFSNSDTEVILCAYAKWGVKCLQKFNGIFSFAIWDKEKKELFLARDQFGVKPLYYYYEGGKFIFSSEAKAIFEHSVARELNLHALNNYFRFLYVLGPETMWNSIKKLPPANYAVLKNGSLMIERYFKLEFREKKYTAGELKELVKQGLQSAVKRQLVSDRPVGLFLSGGLDSSAICAMMAEEASGPIKTFSVGFDTEIETEKFNADFNIAKQTARYFKTDHCPITISAKDVAAYFEECIIAMDEPVSNHIQVATYLLAREAKKQVAVVLGGDGGDETWGGYDRYYYADMIEKLQRFFPMVKNKNFFKLCGRLTGKEKLFEKLSISPGIDLFLSFMAQKEDTVAKFLKKEYNNPLAPKESYAPYFTGSGVDAANQMMLADIGTWLTDESLIRSDKLTMAHGLEERVPFLDKELVQLAFSVSSKYKLRNREQGKKILREALTGMVPEFVLEQKKRGFFSPAAKWLRGDLKNMAYEILSSGYSAKTADLFNWNEIKNILDNHIEKKEYGLNTIWSLMIFRVWARNYL